MTAPLMILTVDMNKNLPNLRLLLHYTCRKKDAPESRIENTFSHDARRVVVYYIACTIHFAVVLCELLIMCTIVLYTESPYYVLYLNLNSCTGILAIYSCSRPYVLDQEVIEFQFSRKFGSNHSMEQLHRNAEKNLQPFLLWLMRWRQLRYHKQRRREL